MKRRTGIYSVVLTSVICMLGVPAFAASTVRMLGTGGGSVVGSSNVTTGATVSGGAKSGVGTSAVSQTTRASSLRFAPGAGAGAGTSTAAQSYSGLVSNNNGTSSGGIALNSSSSPARLSVGKYLNLSHNNNVVIPGGTGGGTGTGTSGGTGASGADVDALRSELDTLRDQVDQLKDDKQNSLIVGNGDYIDISGPDNNVISIDIQALQSDLQNALDTDKPVLTEIDNDYKLWWCYANSAKNACVGDKQLVVDLGDVLDQYDLANENVSLVEALAGKQGLLSEADNGFIAINQSAGTIDVKFNELKEALGIADNKTSEIEYDSGTGVLRWRYTDEYETDSETGNRVKKWHTADITALIQQSLDNYVQIQTLEDYVKKSELSGLQSELTASEDGYLQIQNNQIGVKFDELKSALNIPSERNVELEFDDDGKIKWHYVGDTTWNTTTKKVSDFVDLSAYVLRSELAGLQGALTASDNGYLEINNNQIGIKFNDLKTALNIPDAQRDIEMEITSAGVLRWRYVDQFESDGQTKSWTIVSESIGDLIDNKLVNYVTRDDLSGVQLTLTTDENGFLEINENQINLKFNDLKTALNIPDAQRDIEMEITSAGVLRWRYVDQFESDGQTKSWTIVSESIGNLIDGKLADYIDNSSLTNILNNYVTTNNLSSELANYATTTYVDNGLATKQVKLTEAENGFIAITATDGSDTIGIKFDELKAALGIEAFRKSEMRVENGVLQWRYLDEFDTNSETGDQVKKWTTVFDLKTLLDGYVREGDFNAAIARIDSELAGKQIKLVPTDGGHILLNEQTGEIAVDMNALRNELSIQAGIARTAELRVFDGKLQWRYTDEFTTDFAGNQEEIWHDLDLSTVELPLYVQKTYLTNNYYNKTYVDNLARLIENNINVTLENLALPEFGPIDNGLYLLSVADGDGEDKNRTWQAVRIVDGEGIIH